MENSNNEWDLDEETVELLGRLVAAIHTIKSLAITGKDLIGLGEAIEAIDSIIEGDEIEVNVGLSVGFRVREGDFEEGIFMCLRINEYKLNLDELTTTYSRAVGSDHSTIDYVYLTPNSVLDELELNKWLSKLDEIKSFPEARLSVSRDHL